MHHPLMYQSLKGNVYLESTHRDLQSDGKFEEIFLFWLF